MSSLDQLLIAVAVVAWIVIRQVRTRPVRERAPWVLNTVLVGYGALIMIEGLKQADHDHQLTAAVALLLILELGMAVAFGAARAKTVDVFPGDGGKPLRRGGWVTVTAWLASLAAHLGIDIVISQTTNAGKLAISTIIIYIVVTLMVQNRMIRARAARMKLPANPV